jgi:hypothetical protein
MAASVHTKASVPFCHDLRTSWQHRHDFRTPPAAKAPVRCQRVGPEKLHAVAFYVLSQAVIPDPTAPWQPLDLLAQYNPVPAYAAALVTSASAKSTTTAFAARLRSARVRTIAADI